MFRSNFTALVLISVVVFMSENAFGQSLPGFQKDYQTALAVSQDKGQVLMIDFYADWCKPCMKLDIEVYGSPEFFDYTSQLACVKVDFESEEGKQLAEKYNVNTLPTVVFLETSGAEIERITSYFPKKRYLPELERIIKGENTVPNMEARFPNNTSYGDLFHLSFYYSRRYYNPKKRDFYFKAFQKLDPDMKRDSTCLLTNLIFQQSLIKGDLSKIDDAKEFVMTYPKPLYQPELAIRISESLIEKGDIKKAYTFFKAYYSVSNSGKDKKMKDHLKMLEKMVKN